LAAPDLGAGVEQPVDCLVIQNRQALQSMGKLTHWTWGHDMINDLFFCTTLTGRRRGHASFVQAGAETPNTGAVAIMPDPRCCAMTNHLLCNAIWLYTVVVLSYSITLVVLTINLPQFYKIKSTNTNVYKL